jgi:hypothetical protein
VLYSPRELIAYPSVTPGPVNWANSYQAASQLVDNLKTREVPAKSASVPPRGEGSGAPWRNQPELSGLTLWERD